MGTHNRIRTADDPPGYPRPWLPWSLHVVPVALGFFIVGGLVTQHEFGAVTWTNAVLIAAAIACLFMV